MPEAIRVAFHTLGCKLNFAETTTLARQLHQRGMRVVAFEHDADVYVLNTCSVTENADKECRQLVRRLRRRHPHACVVVTGCYAQLRPHEVSRSGADLVLGTAEKFQLADHLTRLLNGEPYGALHCSDPERMTAFHASFSQGERTRSFLKIQDGCNYHCSFCTIPRARGASRSATVEQIVQQALELQRAGAQEVVLTGVNVGDFGIVNGRRQHRLAELIKALESETAIPRFRISSIEPNLLSDELIDLLADADRFMPHFHLPLQSGSDNVLAAMRRRYTVAHYADRVARVKQKIPHCCIGADVITGFPAEDEADFQNTFALLRDLPVDYLHVFTYSERPDTDAATMEEKVPLPERKERTRRLRALSARKWQHFCTIHLGTVRPVLFERSGPDQSAEGYTDNYIYVRAVGGQPGQIMSVRLEQVWAEVVSGVLSPPCQVMLSDTAAPQVAAS